MGHEYLQPIEERVSRLVGMLARIVGRALLCARVRYRSSPSAMNMSMAMAVHPSDNKGLASSAKATRHAKMSMGSPG